MTTFFPHLYEYCKAVNLLKEYDPQITKNAKLKRKIQKKRFTETKIYHTITSTTSIRCSLTFQQNQQSNDINFIVYLELKAQRLRESNYYPAEFYCATIETILKEKTQLSKVNNYVKPSEWPLNDEILEQQYKTPNNVVGKHWMFIDYILCFEIAKSLPFFGKLSIRDQQALLMTTLIMNKFLTEAYYSFMMSCDALIFPDGSMPIKMPIIHCYQKDLFERVVEPIKRIKMTKEEYVLLKTIIFCSSKSEAISVEGKAILKKEFHRYSRLLLNHMQAKYGDAPGAVRYSQILSVMEAMIYFAQKAKELYIFISTIEQVKQFPTL